MHDKFFREINAWQIHLAFVGREDTSRNSSFNNDLCMASWNFIEQTTYDENSRFIIGLRRQPMDTIATVMKVKWASQNNISYCQKNGAPPTSPICDYCDSSQNRSATYSVGTTCLHGCQVQQPGLVSPRDRAMGQICWCRVHWIGGT